MQNASKWDFSSGTVCIGDLSIRTHRKGIMSLSQCICISECCVVWQDDASEQKAPLEDSLLSSTEPVSVVVAESESACKAEQSVRDEAVECKQCVQSNQSVNPLDRDSDRSSDSVVTKSDSEWPRSLDSVT